MFIRVKKTPNSPRCSIQIVESTRVEGKVRQKIVKHVGVAQDDRELEELKILAESIKRKLELENCLPLFTPEELESEIDKAKKKMDEGQYSDEDYIVNVKNLIEEDRVITGIHDIYGKLFDELHLNSIFAYPSRNKKSLKHFKNIVLARIAKPDSKRASVNMLEENFGISLNLDSVYKMMDKINDKSIEKLNSLAYNKTKDLFGGNIDVIYFDATTLYFESFTEDEFKKNGYSKDRKFNQPQVVLALMVTKEGLPIGYEAFSGDTFDGHTLIPSLKVLREKYNIDKVVYVADSGMFNNDNLKELEELEEHEFNYIVGARIKNLSNSIKEQIVNQENYRELNADKTVARFTLDSGRKLVVTYSKKRAKKDKADREKGIKKLKDKLEKEKSVKSHLSNHGYKKYLQLEESTQQNDKFDKQKDDNNKKKKSCDLTIVLNEDKIKEDEKWDGLKGLVINANSTLSNDEILTQYNNLWQVEESFRITKHDLKIRPIYHWSPKRVKAHLAISFAAYMLTRYLEYRVRLQYKKLSPQIIRNLLLNVQKSIVYDKSKKIKYIIPSKIKPDAKKIYNLMEVSHSLTPYILGKL
ncbi:IS1634 family transposase [Sulfurovum sp. bin170]|uniref:IS1634 family transposase n=1 Tax=Sulfurovum sp. bin170 TaxID=2695268 RepID=UPI0013E0C20C|nr:IS1634 family transposase [Sulfurovum sp. bin170]NEW60365.1 IS1634 family transposase [Sulfurovum sp. bin170]